MPPFILVSEGRRFFGRESQSRPPARLKRSFLKPFQQQCIRLPRKGFVKPAFQLSVDKQWEVVRTGITRTIPSNSFGYSVAKTRTSVPRNECSFRIATSKSITAPSKSAERIHGRRSRKNRVLSLDVTITTKSLPALERVSVTGTQLGEISESVYSGRYKSPLLGHVRANLPALAL
jgi:hypothetical protein